MYHCGLRHCLLAGLGLLPQNYLVLNILWLTPWHLNLNKLSYWYQIKLYCCCHIVDYISNIIQQFKKSVNYIYVLENTVFSNMFSGKGCWCLQTQHTQVDNDFSRVFCNQPTISGQSPVNGCLQYEQKWKLNLKTASGGTNWKGRSLLSARSRDTHTTSEL